MPSGVLAAQWNSTPGAARPPNAIFSIKASYWAGVHPGPSNIRAIAISWSPVVLRLILLLGVSTLNAPIRSIVKGEFPAMRRSTTTPHAILGLLALRPRWSTWELTKQMRRNLRFFWPRAESRIFAEARRLEADGLARAERSYVGQRARTTYSVTDEGMASLRRWLATPPSPTSLECEPLLRVILAELSGPDVAEHVGMALERVRADAHAILDAGRIAGPEYLAG